MTKTTVLAVLATVLAVAVSPSLAAPGHQSRGEVRIVIAGTNDTFDVTDGSLAGRGSFRATGAIADKGAALGYRTVKGDFDSAKGALITLRYVTKGRKGTITYLVNIDTKAETARWTIVSGTKAFKGLHGKGIETENADFTVSTLTGTVWR
jgi:hypothetical protein